MLEMHEAKQALQELIDHMHDCEDELDQVLYEIEQLRKEIRITCG